jgi:glutathione S-transferase
MSRIRVHTFSPLWEGLPAGGPFDLKLLAWLNLAGIPYEQAFQDDTRKGPKRKNPWIELDGERIGDTEIIIDLLGERFNFDIDAGLTPEQKAIGQAWRRAFEEHFHQVFEWELLVHPAGASFMQAGVEKAMPPVVGRLIFKMMQRQMRLQLYARGIARHTPEMIENKGRSDIDALSTFLGDKPFLLIDRPVMADTAIFGAIAPVVYWPMATPVAQYARTVPNIKAYCERMKAHCFGQTEKAVD